MLLGDDARGAEGAVWRLATIGPIEDRYIRVPPILAVEVAGRDEGERELRSKAHWYLDHGTTVVWIVLPATREILVIDATTERRYGERERVAPHADLPGLLPEVARFFRQLG